jgi:hypothetical protein
MTNEDKQLIESLLDDTNEASINRLKEVAGKYGADTSHGCFCKEYNKLQLLNKIRDWYNNYLNDKG